jgi:hypothetical protein
MLLNQGCVPFHRSREAPAGDSLMVTTFRSASSGNVFSPVDTSD